MKTLVSEIYRSTNQFTEFIGELKRYEQTKFVAKEHKDFFIELKKKFIIKSFGKDLYNRLETSQQSTTSCLSQMSLF